MAVASGGQIYVSEMVLRLAGTMPGVTFRDRGRHVFKGFDERWRLYEVGWEQPALRPKAPTPAAARGRARRAPVPPTRGIPWPSLRPARCPHRRARPAAGRHSRDCRSAELDRHCEPRHEPRRRCRRGCAPARAGCMGRRLYLGRQPRGRDARSDRPEDGADREEDPASGDARRDRGRRGRGVGRPRPPGNAHARQSPVQHGRRHAPARGAGDQLRDRRRRGGVRRGLGCLRGLDAGSAGPATNRKTGSTFVGVGPTSVVATFGSVWVSNSGESSVERFSPRDLRGGPDRRVHRRRLADGLAAGAGRSGSRARRATS